MTKATRLFCPKILKIISTTFHIWKQQFIYCHTFPLYCAEYCATGSTGCCFLPTTLLTGVLHGGICSCLDQLGGSRSCQGTWHCPAAYLLFIRASRWLCLGGREWPYWETASLSSSEFSVFRSLIFSTEISVATWAYVSKVYTCHFFLLLFGEICRRTQDSISTFFPCTIFVKPFPLDCPEVS